MKVKEPIEEFIKFNYPSSSQVYCGDSLSYLKKFEKNKFDLIITSPPYNIGKSHIWRRPPDLCYFVTLLL